MSATLVVTGTWHGYPVEVAATWLASRGVYEVVFWINPEGEPIDGLPFRVEHKTFRSVTPATWEALRAALAAHLDETERRPGMADHEAPEWFSQPDEVYRRWDHEDRPLDIARW